MEIKYPNTTVVINDPDGRFESDVEITVTVKYDSQQNVFLMSVPEKKKVSNEPKPQPNKVFEGALSNIKGTITVKGNLYVHMDMPPAKAKALGIKALKEDLNNALAADWKEVFGN